MSANAIRLVLVFILAPVSMAGTVNAQTTFPPVIELSALIGAGSAMPINGVAAEDHVRTLSAIGDINGDGIDDFALGAVGADPDGLDRAGQSYVIFGSPALRNANAIELADLDGTDGFTIDGIRAGDGAGRWVSGLGDFNDDGINDFAIGALNADPNGRVDAGEAYVIFGSNAGFPATLELSALNGSNGFTIRGAAAGDNLGHPVSTAGDINNDSIPDLLIGANFADPGGRDDAGEAYVVYGSGNGFPAVLQISALNGSNGFRMVGDNAGDEAGFSVRDAGDINADGMADIIVGAPFADPNGITDSGITYIVYGNQSGFPATLQLGSLNGVNGFAINGMDAGGVSGRSVYSAGDVNGDGASDIIIGATFTDIGSRVDAGRVFAVFGNAAGFSPSINLSQLDGSNGFRMNGIEAGDFTGRNVGAAGDVNGDGLDDLFIGARGSDPDGRDGAGRAYIVFGATTGLPASLNLADLDGANGFAINGIDAGDRFSRQVGIAGDLDNDGVIERAALAPFASPDGTDEAGEAYIFFSFDTPNSPPVLNPIGDRTTTVGQLLNFTVTATDPGDTLTLTASGLPGGAAFTDNENGSAVFNWTAMPADAGGSPFTITFAVTDSQGITDQETITITLADEVATGFQQSSGPQGILSIEAENFSANQPRDVHRWARTTVNGASNSEVMQATPDRGTNNTTTYVSDSPRLDYDVNFVYTGVHYVWVRGRGINNGADSIHAGLDGQATPEAAGIKGFDPDNQWVWENNVNGLLPIARINVGTAGAHTLNLWMREDGFSFDKILLTVDPNFTPTGNGPDESPAADTSNENQPPVLAPIGAQTTSEGVLLSVEVSASDPGDTLTMTTSLLPAGASFVDNGSGTGTFSWTPAAGTAGPYSITFTVTDSQGETDQETIEINVNPGANPPPVLDAIGARVVTENELLSFSVAASDPGDTLTMTSSTLPAGATFIDNAEGVGIFNWTPLAGAANDSPYSITFTATDSQGATDRETISVTVNAAATGGGNGFQQSSGEQGFVSIEAENFARTTTAGNRSWVATPGGGASSGNAMRAAPDNRVNNNTGYVTNSPRLDYDVNFVRTGRHYLWVRGLGPNSGADSIHAGLNGAAVASAANIKGFDPAGQWIWENRAGNLVATIDIATTGTHTLNLWMREDGFIVDKLILTTDASFAPQGEGPAQSPQAGNSNQPPVLDSIGARTVTEGQLLSFAVTANDPGDTLTLTTSTLPFGASFIDNNGTGIFNWTPIVSDVEGNPYSITFTVTDSEGATDQETVIITVDPADTGGSGDGAFQQDNSPQGIVSIEAENFSTNLPQGNHTWTELPGSGASGTTGMRALPERRTNNNTGYISNSPRLDYDITFVRTGTHYLWVRGRAPNNGGDSIHAGLNGGAIAGATGIKGFNPDNEWVWENLRSGGLRATIEITTAGTQTLNLWMREDGFHVDKIVLTTDPGFTPENSGPSESSR